MSRITTRTPKTEPSPVTGRAGTEQPYASGRNASPFRGSRSASRDFSFGSMDHILFILSELDKVYGYGKLPASEFATGEPLDGLMLTLMSQNTNDRNRDVAYGALRSKHPVWRDVARLDAHEIANLIRPAGLGDTKAARMRDILGRIFNDFGDYSLADMLRWTPEEVRAYLSALPGIGPKTVACVMAFDLDMPAFPVDTHVARLSRRLGWAQENATPEKIQDFLEMTVPPEYCRGGHLDMIEHGRKICHARKPECRACTVYEACKYCANSEPALPSNR
jgi:endonuclease-3